MRGTKIFLGHDDENHAYYADIRLGPDDMNVLTGRETTTHETLTSEPLVLSMTYDERGPRGFESGGAGLPEAVTRVTKPAIDPDVLARIGEVADRWHLNGMTAGCAHQADAWTCSAQVPTGVTLRAGGHDVPETRNCGTLNGWAEVQRVYGEHPYPHRGDACHSCGRNRWDEPTDHCPETGYRFGTAWLVETLPPEIVAEVQSWGVKIQEVTRA